MTFTITWLGISMVLTFIVGAFLLFHGFGSLLIAGMFGSRNWEDWVLTIGLFTLGAVCWWWTFSHLSIG